jgi:plastocyanin
MKKSRGSNLRFMSVVAFLFVIFILLISCNKSSSIYGTTGSTGSTGGTGGPGPTEVFIQGMTFNPSTITVTAGTSVSWTNKDAISHTVTSDTGLFDSGTLAANGTYSYAFMTEGTFAYHCKIHPTMVASVIVTAAPMSTPGY